LSKRNIYILGIITLFIFPLPAYFYWYWQESISLKEFIRWDEIWKPETVFGISFGIIYAFFALLFMGAPVFEKLPNRVENLVKSMRLNVFDAVFLSICAGVGEELLFRAGIQPLLGVWITSIFFVAIHGYLNPFNWRMSLYGFLVLPFILLISFGFYTFGQWFSIGAHFSYDLILFLTLIYDKDETISQ
jgi:membrane protease YdiL (CAAX protease family)